MIKAEKIAQIEEIKERTGRMSSAVLTNFKGIDVEKMTALRDKFREVDVDFKVVKNTLYSKATEEESFHGDISSHLAQPTAVAWSYDDPSAAAKVIIEFQKSETKLEVKCGVLDGKILDQNGVIALSKMPGKNELLSTLLATFIEPPTGFVRLLTAAPTSFVHLLDARKRSLEE